jgi:hypothetical protein
MIGGRSQEHRFTMTAPSVVDGKRFACIDADANLRGRVIRILACLSEDVDDKLADRHRLVDPIAFGVVWLRDNGMQTLIVKIHKQRVHPLQDARNRALVHVKEAQRASMAGFAFDRRHMQHIVEI